MKVVEIIDALAFDCETEPLRFNMAERMQPDALLNACAGFINLSEDAATIKLAHSSVKEYFLSAKRPRELYGECGFSEQTAHHLLSRTCIAYLCSFDRVLEDGSDLKRYPLALYAAKSWAFHASRCVELHLDQSRGAGPRQKPRTLQVFFVFHWLNLAPLSALVQFLRPFTAVGSLLSFLDFGSELTGIDVVKTGHHSTLGVAEGGYAQAPH
jgi:hypothetical protein